MIENNTETNKENNEQETESLAMELLKELKLQNKRLVIALFVVLGLWTLTIGGFIWYLYQYDFTTYEIASDGGGNANYIGNDGDIYNGQSASTEKNQKKRRCKRQRNFKTVRFGFEWVCKIYVKGNIMLKIPDFTKPEIDYIKSNANFTIQERELFDLRNSEYSLEECAEKMNVSVSTIYRISKKMKKKILKLI